MQYSTEILPILGIILFFGLLIPSLFKWFHLPIATSLILAGLIAGPGGLNYVSPNETLKMFAFVGANFLMLLAGFESPAFRSEIVNKKGFVLMLFSSLLPAMIGLSLTRYFDYSWATSLFVAAMFLTSSILITFSTLDQMNLYNVRIEKTIKSLVASQDLTGALISFVIFKNIEPHSRFSLPILLGLLVSLVIVLRLFLSEIISYLFQKFTLTYGHESRLRLIIALLLAITFVFSVLDVPSVIASFLIGYVLSSIPNIDDIKEKLKTIGHGFFIPIFLFLIGLELDFSFIKEFTSANFIFLLIVSSAIIAKICFGTLGSLLIGISAKDSLTLGLLSTTRLTVTASVGYIAFQMGIIDELIYTSLISLTAISSLVMPPLTVFIHRCWR